MINNNYNINKRHKLEEKKVFVDKIFIKDEKSKAIKNIDWMNVMIIIRLFIIKKQKEFVKLIMKNIWIYYIVNFYIWNYLKKEFAK